MVHSINSDAIKTTKDKETLREFKKYGRVRHISFKWDKSNSGIPEHLSIGRKQGKKALSFEMEWFLALQPMIDQDGKIDYTRNMYFEELDKIANLFVCTHGVYPYWEEIMKVIDPLNRYFKKYRIMSTNQSKCKSLNDVFRGKLLLILIWDLKSDLNV